jgi:hypothetical protein
MVIDSELRSKDTWLISEDGLWEIGIGLSLLGLGLTLWLSHPIWFIGFVMLAYFLVVMAGKEVITRPRMVYWSIDDKQLERLAKWLRAGIGLLLLILVISAIAFWFIDTESTLTWLPKYGEDLLVYAIPVILLIFGYLTQSGFRYYLYAGLAVLALIICLTLNFSNILFVLSTAVILILSGVVSLALFIVKYPKPNARENVQY